ncbi:MAG: T9SS type A sorting domain-containing protein [Candidatus Neomarinimicrobiota bacterium]
MKKFFLLLIAAEIFIFFPRQGLSQTWFREDYNTDFIIYPRFVANDGNVVCAQFNQDKVGLVKVEAGTGDILWERSYSASGYTEPFTAIEIWNSMIVVTGTDGPARELFRNYLLWTDKDGKKIADTTWRPIGFVSSVLKGVIIDSDSTIILSGVGRKDRLSQFLDFSFLTKIILKNEKITFVSETVYSDFSAGTICKTDDGYLIAGIDISTSAELTGILFLSKRFEIMEKKLYNFSPSRLAARNVIKLENENGYILAGYSMDGVAATAKIDLAGNLLWAKRYDDEGLISPGEKTEIKNIWAKTNMFIALISAFQSDPSLSWFAIVILNSDGSVFSYRKPLNPGYAADIGVAINENEIILGGIRETQLPFRPWMARMYVSPVKIENPEPIKLEIDVSTYPNPFNANTKIEFDLPKQDKIQISIFDLQGNTVLETKKIFECGKNSITWNGTNRSGQAVGNGIYLVRIFSKNFSAAKKITLMK